MTNINTGKFGEDLALHYLEDLGHIVVTTNFRYKKLGEIDIITKKTNLLHFVEVKTRKNNDYGFPVEFVSNKKLSKIIKVAEIFRKQSNLSHLNYQFDIVSITLDNNKIEYYQNVTL